MKQTGTVDVRRLERAAQFLLAQQLVGCEVTWAHLPDGPRLRVEAATSDGMVQVSGFSGDFAPELFVRVEAIGAVDPQVTDTGRLTTRE